MYPELKVANTPRFHLPQTLDEIIKLHRDVVTLRQSTTDELGQLPPMITFVDGPAHIKDVIDDWRIICLTNHGKAIWHVLLGFNRRKNCPFMTSVIKSADIKNSLVLTQNSMYELGPKGEGEPGQDLLLHVCATFCAWGFGPQLGVTHVFY